MEQSKKAKTEPTEIVTRWLFATSLHL